MAMWLTGCRFSSGLLGSLVVSLLAAALMASPAGAEQAGSEVGRVAAASIDAGDAHTCAVLTTGAVRCWGFGGFGQLGHDSTNNIGDGQGLAINAAGDVPLGSKATAIATGTSHTCALLTTGAVRCWGYGGDGQLGYDSPANVGDGGGDPSIQAAGDVPLGGKATAITAGASHTCVLLTTGAVRCWGYGGDGRLGYDNPGDVGDGGSDPSIRTAGDVPLGGKATAITAGASHTCALLTTGAVRCWGSGGDGQLGHDNPGEVGGGGTDPSIRTAGDVPLGGRATAITAGGLHTCALLTTGAVRCWGYGGDGQLGLDSPANVGDGGTDESIRTAGNVPVGGETTAITSGLFHTCAVLTTGSVRCWGQGGFGQLGHNDTNKVGVGGTEPSIGTAGDVPVGAKTTAITAGGYHSCAVLTTRAVRCWGYGGDGELGHDNDANVGDGGTDQSIQTAGDVPVGVPVRVRASTRVSATVTPKRDRHAPYVYALTGRVGGAFVADSATCSGQVKVTVRKGTRLLQTRTPHLDSRCRYHTRIRLTATDLRVHQATRLTAKIHYRRTRNLTASHTKRHLTAH